MTDPRGELLDFDAPPDTGSAMHATGWVEVVDGVIVPAPRSVLSGDPETQQ